MTPLVIAVSSCALFGQKEGETYPKGVAFPFVKALEMVNQRLRELKPAVRERIKIVLIPTSRQDMDHLNKNIKNYNLNIEIAQEKPFLDLLHEIKPVLYLSTNSHNVKEAIGAGFGAATMFLGDYDNHSAEVLRVAFDGDGVLFSDESERVYKEKGLQAFFQNERDQEGTSLALGPLRGFFESLVVLQLLFKDRKENSPIHTYLVTSRGPTSPALRALKTFRENSLETNEAFFLNGAPKGPVLKIIKPHIFFDDQKVHVDGALQNGVVGAHVPYGVRNE
ncbi:cytosolic 5'-nucleotidase 1A-like isoform X2 [Labeo rohita]|uniref:cytosolic 5'-nucleotidase 1A-like isoform X1 n=1 Tax=Labeo rohita TaxID=84645 RepID=UPI0021E22249|nr:cytosolic 5'-nucleotidase 1A-like isoform X1 [Labeo rohita]XP_050981908.1 cytosolic 5'-nucleotidase 1A-like isoform X2 [Labeo rohita]